MEPDLKDAMGSDVQALDPKYDTFGHANDNWKEWTYHGKSVLIPGNCTVDDDRKGGYYVYPMGIHPFLPVDTCRRMVSILTILCGHRNLMRRRPIRKIMRKTVRSYQTRIWYITGRKRMNTEKAKRALTAAPGYYALGDAANIPGPNIKNPRGIRSLSEWYMAPLLYPDYVHKVFELQTERAIASFERIYEVLGNDIDVMYICGTDFGTQRGPFVNPEIFREFYLPYYRKMNGWIHQHTEWKTLKHSCGGIFPILPLLIESEFDAVNPVQCSAAGMDPQALKDTYGKDILFWGGGVDTQKVLPFGKPEEVKSRSKDAVKSFQKTVAISSTRFILFRPIHLQKISLPCWMR